MVAISRHHEMINHNVTGLFLPKCPVLKSFNWSPPTVSKRGHWWTRWWWCGLGAVRQQVITCANANIYIYIYIYIYRHRASLGQNGSTVWAQWTIFAILKYFEIHFLETNTLHNCVLMVDLEKNCCHFEVFGNAFFLNQRLDRCFYSHFTKVCFNGSVSNTQALV